MTWLASMQYFNRMYRDGVGPSNECKRIMCDHANGRNYLVPSTKEQRNSDRYTNERCAWGQVHSDTVA